MNTAAIGPRAPVSHHHADWRASESARAAALADIDAHIGNLKACVHWLIANGIAIISADLRRGRFKPRITVVASPYLHILFKDGAAGAGQHWDAYLGRTVYDWVAIRYGCEIRWEDLS